MATRTGVKLSIQERRSRRFSTNFKVKKVQEIESGLTRISEVCKQYQVSYTNVYRWLEKYGTMKKQTERMIVETLSDTQELLALKKRVADLERIIGQKQIMIDFKDKMIDLAEEVYGVDIKKKFGTTPSGTFGKTGNDMASD